MQKQIEFPVPGQMNLINQIKGNQMDISNILQFQQLRQNNASFASYLLNHRHYMNESLSMDKLSWFIIDSVQRDFKLDCIIMATSLLRFSDVINLNLHQFFSGIDQNLVQNKTGKNILVPFAYKIPETSINYYVGNVYPFFFSYNKISYAINQVIPYPVKMIMRGHNSLTHIFRYLRATHLFMLKKDSKLIASVLGHSSDEAQQYYILNELQEYFNQLNL